MIETMAKPITYKQMDIWSLAGYLMMESGIKFYYLFAYMILSKKFNLQKDHKNEDISNYDFCKI
jgi:hypothetical protein